MVEEEKIMEEMSMSMTTTGRTLPQGIVIDILSRLPVQSLINSFKLVCKDWHTLIQDPQFINIHLNRRRVISGGGGGGSGSGGGDNSPTSNNSHNLLICKSGNELFQLHPPFNFEQDPFPPAQATKLDHFDLNLLSSSSSSSRLVGSCNGLVCMSVTSDETVIILNPSTRRYKVSPRETIEGPPNKCVSYGFGCSSDFTAATSIDEYKVVRIAYFVHDYLYDNRPGQIEVKVYCMTTNSWRRVASNITCCIALQRSGVFVNGALHWIGYSYTLPSGFRGWDTIVSFNIRDEEFRQFPVPSFDPKGDMILLNMRGCLAMVHLPHCSFKCFSVGDMYLKIWIMKEYGIRESWTQEFVIISPDSLCLSEQSARSMACFLKGDQILIEGQFWPGGKRNWPSGRGRGQGYRTLENSRKKRLVLYDMNSKKTNGDLIVIGVPDIDHSFDQVSFIESLVSLKSSTSSSLLPLSNTRKRRMVSSSDTDTWIKSQLLGTCRGIRTYGGVG